MAQLPVSFFLDSRTKDIASWRALAPDDQPQRLLLGEDYWIALTWARLRDAGVDVRLVDRMPDRGVVVFYAGDKRAAWRFAGRGDATLFVAVRSDRSPVGFADVEVVQNASSADGRRAFHVPHWPQPGLRRRDGDRGCEVRTVLFPGTPQNLDAGFRSQRWQDFLVERGIEFRCHDDASAEARTWADLHDVDVLLAVRPASMGLVRHKPAWKLFNAWLAGMPAILGPESGYRELRRGPLDFIEARDADAAMAAIDRLRQEPGLYAAMVDNGQRRGVEVAVDVTLGRWQTLIDEVLLPMAAAQQARPPFHWHRHWREAKARLARLAGGR